MAPIRYTNLSQNVTKKGTFEDEERIFFKIGLYLDGIKEIEKKHIKIIRTVYLTDNQIFGLVFSIFVSFLVSL